MIKSFGKIINHTQMLEKYLKNTRSRKQGLISFKIKRTYKLDKQNLTIPSNVICAVYISGWYSAYMCLLTKRFFSPCSTFNWTVPFCSYLMCVIFTLGTVVLYLVPLKFLLLAWGKVFFSTYSWMPYSVVHFSVLESSPLHFFCVDSVIFLCKDMKR